MTPMGRSGWAAVGAAVAITLGGGGFTLVHATTSTGEKPIYVPINPCRLADTRPAPFTVGPRTAPLGPDETYTLHGWGAVGDCNLPSATAALALNVTAVDPTQATYLTVFPTGALLPTTSNLNPAPGQPPTPNAVNVDLSPTGEFNVFNKFGQVHLVVDVVGYYDDHNHDDRYYTKTQSDQKIDAAVMAAAELLPTPGRSMPALTDELAFSSYVSETVTSSVTGQWLISKTVRAYLTCPTVTPIFFLTLDGTPLYSSAVPVASGTYTSLTLVGGTTGPVAAGGHTVTVGADCPNEYHSGSGYFAATAANVTVMR